MEKYVTDCLDQNRPLISYSYEDCCTMYNIIKDIVFREQTHVQVTVTIQKNIQISCRHFPLTCTEAGVASHYTSDTCTCFGICACECPPDPDYPISFADVLATAITFESCPANCCVIALVPLRYVMNIKKIMDGI